MQSLFRLFKERNILRAKFAQCLYVRKIVVLPHTKVALFKQSMLQKSLAGVDLISCTVSFGGNYGVVQVQISPNKNFIFFA